MLDSSVEVVGASDVVAESADDVVLSSLGSLVPVPAPTGGAPETIDSVSTTAAPVTNWRRRVCTEYLALDSIGPSFNQSRRRQWARRNAPTVAVVQQRLPSLLDPPIGFAHRGARDRAPENTIEAFQIALQLGATGLESDVWLTADGVAVLDHDGTVRLGRRRRSIARCLAEDLPEHIPTLRRLLDECGVSFHLSLDLQQGGIGAAAIDVVASAAGDLLDRLWLCTSDLDELVALRRTNPEVRLVHSTRLSKLADGPERAAAVIAAAGIDAINLHYTDWSGGLVALFHRFERVAFAWDLQYDHVLHPAVRMGLDGVYSDHVDVMMQILAAEYVSPESLDYRRDLT